MSSVASYRRMGLGLNILTPLLFASIHMDIKVSICMGLIIPLYLVVGFTGATEVSVCGKVQRQAI